MCGAINGRRLPGQFFENAIELRKRLEADRERDFTDPKIDIFQKFLRVLESNTGNVIDKLRSSNLLEFFAEVSRIDLNYAGHFFERERLG